MPLRILASISHKGGTGRTTTTANVGYRLALKGHSVCWIDLDLTSPTFGAVAGLRGYEQGAEVGVHDFLCVPENAPRPPDAATDALLDIWALSDLPRGSVGTTGRLRLLPGSRTKLGLPLVSAAQQGEILAQIISSLAGEYDFMFLDVRSGASDTVEAVLTADDQVSAIAWLVFFRWTPQHLAGAADLCERLDENDADISLVRTAVIDPADKAPWYAEQNRALTAQARDLLGDWPVLAHVPSEPMLQWREAIIVDELVEEGIAQLETVESYIALAGRLEGL